MESSSLRTRRSGIAEVSVLMTSPTRQRAHTSKERGKSTPESCFGRQSGCNTSKTRSLNKKAVKAELPPQFVFSRSYAHAHGQRLMPLCMAQGCRSQKCCSWASVHLRGVLGGAGRTGRRRGGAALVSTMVFCRTLQNGAGKPLLRTEDAKCNIQMSSLLSKLQFIP